MILLHGKVNDVGIANKGASHCLLFLGGKELHVDFWVRAIFWKIVARTCSTASAPYFSPFVHLFVLAQQLEALVVLTQTATKKAARGNNHKN